MDWYSVTITEACVRDGEYHRLCRRFQQSFIAAGAPPEMAMFAQTVVRDGVRKVYFSPGSIPYVRPILEQQRAAVCEPPGVTEVTLVFGVPGAEERLAAPAEEALGYESHGDGAVLFPAAEEVVPVRSGRSIMTTP